MSVKIQASIMGFSSKPVSVYSVYDESADYLIIHKEGAWREEPLEGCSLISDALLDSRDFLFDQSKVGDGINAYYDALGMRSLEINNSASSCNPEAHIEYDGLKEGGKVYRLSPDMSNSQVAVLATCLYVNSLKNIRLAENMTDDLFDIMKGDIYTI